MSTRQLVQCDRCGAEGDPNVLEEKQRQFYSIAIQSQGYDLCKSCLSLLKHRFFENRAWVPSVEGSDAGDYAPEPRYTKEYLEHMEVFADVVEEAGDVHLTAFLREEVQRGRRHPVMQNESLRDDERTV